MLFELGCFYAGAELQILSFIETPVLTPKLTIKITSESES